MKVFYDTEFIDDGKTIELISIGMVDEDDNELYLINAEVDLRKLARHNWLRANVVPYLPMRTFESPFVLPNGSTRMLPLVEWDFEHRDGNNVHTRSAIRERVRQFLLGRLKDSPELWAWYGAYDHIALAQLFGPMVALPNGIPMWTNDLRQVVQMGRVAGVNLDLPARNAADEHHALADARWLRLAHDHLAKLEADGIVRWALG